MLREDKSKIYLAKTKHTSMKLWILSVFLDHASNNQYLSLIDSK